MAISNNLSEYGALGGISGGLQQQQISIKTYADMEKKIEDLEKSGALKDAIIDSYVALIEKQMSLIRMLSGNRG